MLTRNLVMVATAWVATVGCLAAAEPANQGPSLVGTWRLVEYTDIRNGKAVHPFGDPFTGILIYTAEGTMSVHVLHNPKPFTLQDLTRPSRQIPSLQNRSYVGYFGTYRIDPARSIVVHH
jgi:hypothetical protein